MKIRYSVVTGNAREYLLWVDSNRLLTEEEKDALCLERLGTLDVLYMGHWIDTLRNRKMLAKKLNYDNFVTWFEHTGRKNILAEETGMRVNSQEFVAWLVAYLEELRK